MLLSLEEACEVLDSELFQYRSPLNSWGGSGGDLHMV